MRLTGLRGSAVAVVAAELVRAHGERPVLVLTSSSKRGDALLGDLRQTLGERGDNGRLRAFPRHDTLPYDRFSPQPFLVAQRMDVLYRWLAAGAGQAEPAPVVVAPWTALAARVPTREAVRARTSHLEVGQWIDRDALVATLVAAGYQRMPLVEERGELAVRGGIVDLFPPHRRHPVRVEFLGDQIESIRDFDPASQRSQSKLAHVAAPPPREWSFDRDTVVARSDDLREAALEQEIDEREVETLIDSLLRGHLPPGGEALVPFLAAEWESPLDFLPDDALVLIDGPEAGADRLARYEHEAETSYVGAREGGRLVAAPSQLLTPASALHAALERRSPVEFERLDVADGDRLTQSLRTEGHDTLRRELTQSRSHERALTPLADQLEQWRRQRWRSVIAMGSLSAAERLRALLADYGIDAPVRTDPRPAWSWSRAGRVEIQVGALAEGFSFPQEKLAVVTEEEIFGAREKRRQRSDWREGMALEGLAQLAAGDPLVHADHGIGTYRGLVEIEAGGVSGEYLCLEYLGADRLFLPVHRLHRVQRYAAAEGTTPRIDRLGGQTWERAKRGVRKSLRNMAKELLAVHAARELAPGFAFAPRDRHFEEFEATFPFEETPDQRGAIDDVLADMQQAKPMDRLVCGDVGYGKTEVAVRAAFRAALDGKQVAVLVPTTVLCQQHEQSFRQRFEGHPVRVESLSRFRSAAEAREVLEGLANGRVDVVVGTHRLLQKNVQFRDLGLLVVDEEHRFGVTHKERIKQLKKTVDVLTLTATPIPRTLQMAFTGIRDLSVINTPPADRLAVRTQLCREGDGLVREAILREVRRGGQVFFVHNRVQTIGAVAEMLARVVPEVKVLVAHGQMKERELEARMLAFLRGEADVLLCTTIIESGLDVPRANTILINRAHALGLAQLYQLRGRVGRSHHRAYAYLLVPHEDVLSNDAERRLEAIQDLSELGSGFRLANMDLEIRGAGDLLGSTQSGNLAAVGYETYMEMLEETVDELRGQVHETEIDPEIRLPVAARLPEDYVTDVGQRLVLYKRLASARDDHEIDRVRDEILDRYGPLPEAARHLVEVVRLQLRARELGIEAVDLVRGELVLRVATQSRIDPQRLVRLLGQPSVGLRVTPDHKLYAPAPPASQPDELFAAAKGLLKRLAA
ncbi:MAG: transcription-repair coupling factor [Proteobacteria bacterium]|nr:transcription-repair coupling factor [Pseudomonadota bacterium]